MAKAQISLYSTAFGYGFQILMQNIFFENRGIRGGQLCWL